MFELASVMRADGKGPVFDLSLGNPSLEPPQCWKNALRSLIDTQEPGHHRYMPNAGYPEVRSFIAQREKRRYGIDFAQEDVLMTVGAAGALNTFLRSVINPGDEVIVPAPYFTEYDHYCINSGAVLRPVESQGASFALPLEGIAQALNDKTRVVLINSPNNPTGSIYSEDSLAALGKLLNQHRERTGKQVYVVEDSPYRNLVYDGSDVPSMLRHYDETIFITSHSKDLGLAGERIGYLLVSPRSRGRELLLRALTFCNRVLGFVNAPALMQRVLPRVLDRDDARVDVNVYASNAQKMASALVEMGFELEMPRAGFFLFPRLPTRLKERWGRDCDVQLTEQLREMRTIVVPGVAFGVQDHLRLSMCVGADAVEGAIAAFRQACR